MENHGCTATVNFRFFFFAHVLSFKLHRELFSKKIVDAMRCDIVFFSLFCYLLHKDLNECVDVM